MEQEVAGEVPDASVEPGEHVPEQLQSTPASDLGKPPLLPGGGSLSIENFEAGADSSTAASGERDVDLEFTLNSNASKEFSFGTTKPAPLPSAAQLEVAAPECRAAQPGPRANDQLERARARHRTVEPRALSDGLQEALVPEASGPVAKPAEETFLSPKADSEGGELFTFGTTIPLKLPDPALLRQMGCAEDIPPGVAAERSAETLALPSGERRTPRWEPADNPLPSVQEISQPQTPPPVAALPEQAAQISPYHAQVAQQWQMQQAPQMSPEYAHHAQMAQQWQMQQAQEAQRLQDWHEELQKQQREAAEVAHLQVQATKSHDVEAQRLANSESYGPYFGEKAESVVKVQPERSKSRLAAGGCIIVLAVLAAGIVALLASTA